MGASAKRGRVSIDVCLGDVVGSFGRGAKKPSRVQFLHHQEWEGGWTHVFAWCRTTVRCLTMAPARMRATFSSFRRARSRARSPPGGVGRLYGLASDDAFSPARLSVICQQEERAAETFVTGRQLDCYAWHLFDLSRHGARRVRCVLLPARHAGAATTCCTSANDTITNAGATSKVLNAPRYAQGLEVETKLIEHFFFDFRAAFFSV